MALIGTTGSFGGVSGTYFVIAMIEIGTVLVIVTLAMTSNSMAVSAGPQQWWHSTGDMKVSAVETVLLLTVQLSKNLHRLDTMTQSTMYTAVTNRGTAVRLASSLTTQKTLNMLASRKLLWGTLGRPE
jgi:hypothetical protein